MIAFSSTSCYTVNSFGDAVGSRERDLRQDVFKTIGENMLGDRVFPKIT